MKNKSVLITWEDSLFASGWTLKQDWEKPKLLIVESLGWVVDETEEAIRITGSLGQEPKQAIGMLTIPKKAILKMKKVKIPQ